MSEQDQGGKERRKHVRVACDFDISYRINSAPDVRMRLDDREKASSMLNISEGGLAFVTDSPICEGEELEIKFNLEAEGQTRNISAVGRVCYCIELADRQMSRVGVEFVDLQEADRRAIAEMIKGVGGSWSSRFLK